MANSFGLNPTLADPLDLVTGRPLTSASVGALGEVNNWLMAEMGAANLWSQAWPGGIPVNNGAPATTASVRVPIVASGHTALTALVDCDPGAADFHVGIAAIGAAMTTLPAGSPRAWYRVTAESLVLSPTEIKLITEGPGTIYGVSVEVAPSVSPLTTIEDGAEPLGLVSLGAGYPMTAHTGRALIDNIAPIADRPRMLMAWSAVDATSAGASSRHPSQLLGRAIGGWSRRHPGIDATYEVHVKYTSAGGGTVYVGRAEVVCPAGNGWVSTTVTIRADEQAWEHDLPPENGALEAYLRGNCLATDSTSFIDSAWVRDGIITGSGVSIEAVCVWGV